MLPNRPSSPLGDDPYPYGGAMRTSTLVLLALLTVGCDAASDPTGAAPGDARFSQGVTGNFPSAEGHALIGFQRGGQTVSQSYSFTAQFVGRNNGRLLGQWVLQQTASDGGAQVQGRVTCFISLPNTAKLRGVIERSDNPAFPIGAAVTWTVVDNGEGANDPRDEASPMTVFDPLGNSPFCAGAEPLVPITHGNIQVRAFGGGGES